MILIEIIISYKRIKIWTFGHIIYYTQTHTLTHLHIYIYEPKQFRLVYLNRNNNIEWAPALTFCIPTSLYLFPSPQSVFQPFTYLDITLFIYLFNPTPFYILSDIISRPSLYFLSVCIDFFGSFLSQGKRNPSLGWLNSHKISLVFI